MIDVAVVGCGHMGRLHARTVAAHPGCRLVAAVDPHLQRARAVAELHGAEARADVPDVSVVVVCSPTTTHRQVVEPLLGRWVLVEKALAPTPADAEALVHDRVAVAHSERFHPVVRRLGGLRPVHVHARRLAPAGTRCRDVSAVLDLMVHDLDLLLAWTGAEVLEIGAVGVPERCTAHVRLSGGVTAVLEASRLAVEPVRALRVQERAGFAGADLCSGRVWRRGGALLPPDPRDALTAQWASFVGAVRGEAPLVVPSSHGLRVVRAAARAEASLQPG